MSFLRCAYVFVTILWNVLVELHIVGIVSFCFCLVTKLLIQSGFGQKCLLNGLNINVNVC